MLEMFERFQKVLNILKFFWKFSKNIVYNGNFGIFLKILKYFKISDKMEHFHQSVIFRKFLKISETLEIFEKFANFRKNWTFLKFLEIIKNCLFFENIF